MAALKRTLCLLLIFLLAAPPQTARAWAENGHHIIAAIAFRLLKDDEQAKLLAILEQHPRYEVDFSPPANLPNDDEKLRWRIGRAGYWPDVIRKNLTYDRPTWHYEPGPALVIGDATKLRVPKRPGPLPQDATLETQTLNISQALLLCQNTLADRNKPAAERAIALCWIGHLVGDAHQPCHAGSLFMEQVFTEADGDRGANRIEVKQGRNMHALWDQLLGDEFSLNGTRKRMAELTTDEQLVAQGTAAIATKAGLDPQTWLRESRALSAKHVYAPEVLAALELIPRGLTEKPQPIDLSEDYLKNAGRVAQVRAIEAAYRLAETWRQGLR
jgi:hypothetical protein